MNPVIAIVGPTASGKSTLGIEVALALDGEIIISREGRLEIGVPD